MKTIILVAGMLVGGTAVSDSFGPLDFAGHWQPLHPITKGEETSLTIAGDLSATLERDFVSGSRIVMTAPPQEISGKETLVIFDFKNENDCSTAAKLVLGGWSSSGKKHAFGTLYLYRDGELFNGLPVSFEGTHEEQ